MQRPNPSLFLAFVGILSLVVGIVHYYLYWRLVRTPDLGVPWSRWGARLFVALAVMTPVGLFAGWLVARPIARVISAIVFGWMGMAMLLFFLLAASEIVRASAHLFSTLASGPIDPARRLILSRGIAGTAAMFAVALAGLGTVNALGAVAVRSVRVTLGRLPHALSGFRIVQLSDLHIGNALGADWLEGVVATVNDLDADLVVITGDLVDGSVSELRNQVAPLKNLKSRCGVYFVTGNHEYYSGVDEWVEELGRLGVRVLRNERVSIGDGHESFDLAGVDDWSAGRFGGGHGPDLGRALQGRDTNRELVLLAHQPKQIFDAAAHGVGLQLSGHTHGGQILPWALFVRIEQPYIAGLARHGKAQIYVNRGTGFWGPPMRVAAPSEIAVIELSTT